MGLPLHRNRHRTRHYACRLAAMLLALWLGGCTIPVEVRQAGPEPEPPRPPQPPEPEEADQLVLEATYPGPFEGTLIQRVRDPATHVICYLYVPEQVAHTREDERIDYGSATLGSIDCVADGPGRR